VFAPSPAPCRSVRSPLGAGLRVVATGCGAGARVATGAVVAGAGAATGAGVARPAPKPRVPVFAPNATIPDVTLIAIAATVAAICLRCMVPALVLEKWFRRCHH
jgi:hypothetical protein